MNDPNIDLTICDRESIHVPGSIQPHGLMLVVDPATLSVIHCAGEIETRLGRESWEGEALTALLGERVLPEAMRVVASGGRGFIGRLAPPFAVETFDVTLHMAGSHLLLELEGSAEDALMHVLPQIEAAAASFEKTPTLPALFETAAAEFRRLTGYGRVMIYRFLDDDAGVVVGEDREEGEASFMNHHFPASDIPKQARALYVRNLVRVIPDVAYTPAPLRPVWTNPDPLDMSDSILRSVSPVHIQYLKNMEVGASASISIVKDGVLWGLIACHNATPLAISSETRSACRALAGGLARQIKAREETDAYRERVRLRSFEDHIVSLLSREGSLDTAISNHVSEIQRMLGGDGLAILRGADLVVGGRCPPEDEVRKLAAWAISRSSETVYATDRLSLQYELRESDRPLAAGLLAVTLSVVDPWVVLWFRSEQVEVVNWAGNPHKNMTPGPGGTLTPRASFEMWSETVRGRARRWTIPEIEAAGRLRVAVTGVWQTRRLRDLNRQLLNTLDEKDMLLQQKEFLIGEVNHRVQNSLQLVSSFLSLQARSSDDPKLHSAVEEARRRLQAVSLVHRRLYRADQIDAIDAARYADELLDDLTASFGPEWQSQVTRDLHPVMLPTDRAVGLGLVLTELVINANKYAYGGEAGPLKVALLEDRNKFRLVVADNGIGRQSSRRGFGSRMMEALVVQLGGVLEYNENAPGTRAVLIAPIDQPARTNMPAV